MIFFSFTNQDILDFLESVKNCNLNMWPFPFDIFTGAGLGSFWKKKKKKKEVRQEI